jgi:hypothetical protein
LGPVTEHKTEYLNRQNFYKLATDPKREQTHDGGWNLVADFSGLADACPESGVLFSTRLHAGFRAGMALA